MGRERHDIYAFRVSDDAEFSASYGQARFSEAAYSAQTPSLPAYTPTYAQPAGAPRTEALIGSALAVGVLFSAII